MDEQKRKEEKGCPMLYDFSEIRGVYCETWDDVHLYVRDKLGQEEANFMLVDWHTAEILDPDRPFSDYMHVKRISILFNNYKRPMVPWRKSNFKPKADYKFNP